MKICPSCGYRNWKIVKDDKKKIVCFDCGAKLYEGGDVYPKGRLTVEGNYIQDNVLPDRND